MNRNHRVTCTGSSADEAYSWAAREFSIRLGHMAGANFDSCGDDPYAVFKIVEGVQGRQEALARHAKHGVGTMSDQLIRQNSSTVSHEFHNSILRELTRYSLYANFATVADRAEAVRFCPWMSTSHLPGMQDSSCPDHQCAGGLAWSPVRIVLALSTRRRCRLRLQASSLVG
ncbi:hypothetical protein MPLDJ20_20178 [Mesorhizobium plurifarium]|uniref:Uncharacterized protein n=1 Tax=Mesorhizobium plurifarium TaxID=69974 RepID=A0A090F198_MESPL|nr:hypothetical protein MPLDJ20_20178 [Mesorhizobium plurifarium]